MVERTSMQLRLRKTQPIVWVYLAVAGVCTLGVAPLLLGLFWVIAHFTDSRPVLFDRQGLTTQRGERLSWTNLMQVEPQVEYRRIAHRLVPARWFVVLAFEQRRIAFDPALFEEGGQALLFLEECLGKSVGRPPSSRWIR